MPFRAVNPSSYNGRVVDTGHCVRYCQVACPNLPHTSQWRKGQLVRGGAVAEGTIIATFHGDRYANATDGSSHAAVLVRELSDGLLCWDQWQGQPVHQRTIRFRGGTGNAVNDGDRFFVVETEDTRRQPGAPAPERITAA